MLPDLTSRRAILILCAAAVAAALALGGGARTGPGRTIGTGSPPAPTPGSLDGWFDDWTILRPVAATRPGGPARLDRRDRSVPAVPAVVTSIEVFEFTASLDPDVPMRRQLLDAVEANLARLDTDRDHPAGAGTGNPDLPRRSRPRFPRRAAPPAARAVADAPSTPRGPFSPRTDLILKGELP